jgi:antirestriction protein
MAGRKLIELLIDESADAFGVEAISLVKYPAIESNFVYFSKQGKKEKTLYSMASVDEEKRTLIGAALIPDKHIPRYDEFSDEEYDVYFSKTTVQKASELFLKTHRTNEWTEEHDSKVDGVSVVESWIVSNPEVDKARHFGLDVPEGTWMVRVQVENDEMWQFVKEQKVAGFSIEGYFLDKLEQMSERPKPSLGRRLKSIVTGRKLYAEIEVDNGAVFATEDDEFAAGVSVYKIGAEGTAVEIDNGSYKTKAGTEFEIYDGIVIEWDGQVQEVEDKATEPETNLKDEYMKKYEEKLKEISKTELSSVDEVIVWYRVYNSNSYYSDPEDIDIQLKPLSYRSFDEWQTALNDEVKRLEEKYSGFVADEVEPVDWQFMPNAYYVSTEEGWDNLKTALTIEGQTGIPMMTILEAFSDYMDADDDLDRWWNNVVVWTGSILEYAYHVVEEDLISEEQLVDYFDYEKFGRDLQASGEFADYVGEDEWFSEYEHLPSHVLAEKWFDLTGKEPTDMDAKTLTAYFDYEGLAQDMEYSGAAEYGKGDYKFVVDSSLR